MYLIESSVSFAAPPEAELIVVIVILLNPLMLEAAENTLAPLASVTLLTIYLSLTMLPSETDLPTTSSPK